MDILQKNRAANPPEQRQLDKKDRTDLTYAPDAKKARQVVREQASHSLPLLCDMIAKVTGEMRVKHTLQEAFDAFAEANRSYYKEELRGNGEQLIGWMGGINGMMAALPATAPAHKVELVQRWNAMLVAVNDATKVGIEKKHATRPITLIADLETDKLLLPADEDWG